MLLLGEQDLKALLSMRDVMGAVEDGFRALAGGGVRVPERTHFDMPESSAVMFLMPALASSLTSSGQDHDENNSHRALGLKVVSVFENNSMRGIDIVQGVYLLMDGETGLPLALMEGRFITAIRTAATSAVATRLMATPGPKQLGVFGAGVQAAFHIDAMIEVARVERVMIASRTEVKARALAERSRSRYAIRCDVVSPRNAVTEANLICTCTSSGAPLFKGEWVSPGTHINAVGAFTPTARELDTETIRRARVVIDAQSAAGREAGDILIPIDEGAITLSHVKGTLAEVVSGAVPGRESQDQITLFKSCGLAVEDLVTAKLAYERALAQGAGVSVELQAPDPRIGIP